MFLNATLARAVKCTIVCIQLLAGTTYLAAQNRPVQIAAGQNEPLRFFTIRERMEALRAAGALRPNAAAPLDAVQEETVPLPQTIGLRLTLPGADPETFLGAVPFAVPGGDLAAKWRSAMVRWSRDEGVIRGCEAGACKHPGAKKWLQIREEARRRQGRDALSFVHLALNHSIRYASDFEAFGVNDYWASPLEVVEKRGDCEDYALAKLLMLRSAGFDEAEMKIVALKELVSGEYHAILAVRSEGEWVFLDNKRGALAFAEAYDDTVPIATIDNAGQSMLVRLEKRQFALRLSTL